MVKSRRFNKAILFLVLLGVFSILIAGALAQRMPPKAGTYYCYTTTYTLENPVQVIPAFFGNLILDGKGHYTLTGRKTSGEYFFNKTTGVLSFTGDLKIMKVEHYTDTRFWLVYQGLAYDCGLQGSNSASTSSNLANPAKKLNEGLTGKLLTTVSYQYNNFLGKVLEFDLATGTYNGLFSSGVASRGANGEMIYFDKNARLKITDKTGNKTISQISDAIQYNFDDYYPALSSTGAYVALTVPYRPKTGALTDMVAEGKELLILDRAGKTIGELRGYQQAAWTPNNQILAVGDGKFKQGVFLVNQQFTDAQQVIEGFETAEFPTVSPDGKKIAFYSVDKIWIIGIDGQNRTAAITGSTMSFPTWSPDGKFLAVNVLVNNPTENAYVFIVNLAADVGFWAKDKNDDRIPSRNRISWSK